MSAATRDHRGTALAVVGLALAWGLPELLSISGIASGDGLAARLIREIAWWALGAIILLWVIAVERLPLGSIGLRRPTWRTLLWGVLAAVAMIASVMLSYAIIFPLLGLRMNMSAVGEIVHVPLWLQTATMLRAGIVEEILYRGYAIERLQWLTRSKWAAGLISAAVFIAAHIGSWGYAQLIVVAFGAALLTLLYVWRRDLESNMIAHFLTDFVGFALARAQM